jgi:hypothetical protein
VPIGGYGIGTDATLQDVTDNGATSNDILKLTGSDGIYVDVPNKQFSLGAGNFVNSDTQGFQMVDNVYKIGDIFNLKTKTKLAIDDDDLFIQANSDSFKVLNNANNKDIANLSIAEILLTDNSGATANTLRMYLGNVGIFTTNPTYKFDVHANANNSAQGIGLRNTNAGSSATASLFLGNNTGDNQAIIFLNSTTNTANAGASSLNIGTVANSNVGFISNNTERMRITSGGFTKISNNATYLNVGSTYHELRNTTNDDWLAILSQTSASPYGILIKYSGATPNNLSNNFITCSDSTNDRLIIYSNGNVVNRNNSYGLLSDIKLKENIVDATPKLDKLMQVRIVNYNLIDDPDLKQIGVIAQELEQVFPALVDEHIDRDDENNDLGTTTKSVKMSVFVPILIKAIQEQNQTIQELSNRLIKLESK